MNRERDGPEPSSHACVRTRVHARRTIMRFHAVAAADRFSLTICVCMCAYIYIYIYIYIILYTSSFFLRVALLLHGTSGHVPPVTIPTHPGSPCHQATHFGRPREKPRPDLPSSPSRRAFSLAFMSSRSFFFTLLAADAERARPSL